MTASDEWAEEAGNPMFDGPGQEPDYDDWDDDDYREPDPEDADIARAYEDDAEHRETVHGGGECDCRASLRDRLGWRARDAARRAGNARARLAIAMRGVYTIRVGRAEFTLRLNADRACGACGGRGWFYTFIPGRADDRPPGDNGAGLCGCGSAIASLAESRRYVRGFDREPPF
jgi:hypothetical protein